jgi:hypothetical protein
VALRSNHYDAAFEAFLRQERRPYVAVDESRRALVPGASLKSLDFIVYSIQGRNLLVDVKGRRFPSGSDSEAATGAGAASRGHCWESWATAEDLSSMLQWEQVFGDAFRAALVFAYEIVHPRWRERHPNVWEFRNREYAFYGVWADEYAQCMRSRSPKWETVSLPMRRFAELRRPIGELI